MWARLNDDGTVSVPMRAESGDDEDIIGDGIVVLAPGDDGFDEALAEAQAHADE